MNIHRDASAPAGGRTDSSLTAPPAPEGLRTLAPDLQIALTKGWERLRGDPQWIRFENAAKQLGWETKFDDEFRSLIPHPIYDTAARELCREFRLRAAECGLSLVEDTPGEWRTSTEQNIGAFEARAFTLRVYREGAPYGTLKLIFAHAHGGFDLPLPPTLEVLEG